GAARTRDAAARRGRGRSRWLRAADRPPRPSARIRPLRASRRRTARALKFGIVVFPGSNCEADVAHVVGDVLGQEWRYVWHADRGLGDVDCVVLPGGFAYGDHLRAGAIARFAPIIDGVAEHAARGGLVRSGERRGGEEGVVQG